MDRDLMMSLLMQTAQQKDEELKNFSTRLQAQTIAQAFRRSAVIVALYTSSDEAGADRYMIIKGTEERLRTKMQEALRAVKDFHPLRPTWVTLQVEGPAQARALRDVFELRQYETARKNRPSRETLEFCEQMTPRGWRRFAQTRILERYIEHVRSLGLTLRKIRVTI